MLATQHHHTRLAAEKEQKIVHLLNIARLLSYTIDFACTKIDGWVGHVVQEIVKWVHLLSFLRGSKALLQHWSAPKRVHHASHLKGVPVQRI